MEQSMGFETGECVAMHVFAAYLLVKLGDLVLSLFLERHVA